VSGGAVVCLLGPTGTGKTAAALALAARFKGAVVNFDSRQVYAGLAVVTAQPTPGEQAACPHRLYGFLPPCEAVTAGAFIELAAAAVEQVQAAGGLPILVGGTGLYLDSLLGGLAPIPEVPQTVRMAVQAACQSLGPEALHARLAEVDPAYAARIHPRDRQRVTRALEVYRATGRPLSAWHAEQAPGRPRFAALKIGLRLPQEALKARLAERIEAMLAAGALDEMRAALERCPDEDAPGYSGIGCRELIDVIRGRMDLDTAKAQWLKRTRAYAKRQLTWFARDPDIAWFAPGEHAAMIRLVAERLGEEGRGHEG